MTTPAEIEAAFLALPADQREPLLERVWQKHWEDPANAPPLTPEQVAELDRRTEEVERGEGDLIDWRESVAGISEGLRRVAAGEDPETVRAEIVARRVTARQEEGEAARAA